MHDDELRSIIHRYIHGSAHPDVIRYGSDFLRYFDGCLRQIRVAMAMGRMRSARVLDIGCGFGWHAVCMSLLGASEVFANDVRELMTRVVEQRVSALRAEGVPVRVTPLLGDICALDIPEASFDAIYCNETLEHVHDQDAMYAAMSRLLCRGGRAIITNDNNALCPAVAESNRAMWRQRDESDDFIERLKRERPEENRWIEPYARMRRRILRQVCPTLADTDAGLLAFATAGLTRPAIASAAARYVATGELPTPPQDSWCRNPETGEYCERLINPYQVVEHMRPHGFRATVRHGFTRWPYRVLDAFHLEPLSRLMFRRRAFFAVVAQKA